MVANQNVRVHRAPVDDCDSHKLKQHMELVVRRFELHYDKFNEVFDHWISKAIAMEESRGGLVGEDHSPTYYSQYNEILCLLKRSQDHSEPLKQVFETLGCSVESECSHKDIDSLISTLLDFRPDSALSDDDPRKKLDILLHNFNTEMGGENCDIENTQPERLCSIMAVFGCQLKLLLCQSTTVELAISTCTKYDNIMENIGRYAPEAAADDDIRRMIEEVSLNWDRHQNDDILGLEVDRIFYTMLKNALEPISQAIDAFHSLVQCLKLMDVGTYMNTLLDYLAIFEGN